MKKYIKNAIENIENWYIVMIVLGAFNVSFNIMLIPQIIDTAFEDGLSMIGVVMSSWMAGPLIAPMISKYMDKYFSPKFWISFLLTANGFLLLGVPLSKGHGLYLLFIDLFLQGLIYALGFSLLNLLIIRRFEEKRWHAKTSMLIAAFILGEIIGFAIAGKFKQPMMGLYVAAVIIFITAIVSPFMIPNYKKEFIQKEKKEIEKRQTYKLLFSRFGILVFSWSLLNFAAQILFLPFPVLMKKIYLIDVETSSMTVSLTGIFSIFMYPFIGRFTKNYGAENVLRVSSFAKVIIFAVFAICAFYMQPMLIPLVIFMVSLNRLTWPFMMTSSQIDAAILAGSNNKSLALILYMAFASMGNMLAGFANSLVTQKFGMEYIPLVATVVAAVGVILLMINQFLPQQNK